MYIHHTEQLTNNLNKQITINKLITYNKLITINKLITYNKLITINKLITYNKLTTSCCSRDHISGKYWSTILTHYMKKQQSHNNT